MTLKPPGATRTETPFPNPTLFPSHRPAIVGEYPPRKGDLGLDPFLIDIGGPRRLVEREQAVAPHLHKPVEPGRQTDDERPFQRVAPVGRRRFGDDRNIRGLVTAIGEIGDGRGFRGSAGVGSGKWWSVSVVVGGR